MLRYQENWRSQSQSEKQAPKQLCFFPAVMSPPPLGVTQNSERTRPAAAGSGPPRGNRAAAVAWRYSLHRAGFSQTWRSCAPVHTGTQPAFLKAPCSRLGSGDEQWVFDQRGHERIHSLLMWKPALTHRGAAHTPTRPFHAEARSQPARCLLARQSQPGCAPENAIWWPATAAVWWINSSRELPSGKIKSLQLETSQPAKDQRQSSLTSFCKMELLARGSMTTRHLLLFCIFAVPTESSKCHISELKKTMSKYRRKWQPTPVFYSSLGNPMDRGAWQAPWSCRESNMTKWLNNNNTVYTHTHTHTASTSNLSEWLSLVFAAL